MLSRLFPSKDRRPTARKRPTTRRVTMEQLEDRSLLATVVPSPLPGVVLTSIDSVSNAKAIYQEPGTGNIVASGYTQGGSTRFAVVRFHGDGTLDNSFGSAGSVTTDFNNIYYADIAYAAAPYSGGKILAAGVEASGTTTQDFALARYNSNGTPDSTFGVSTKKGPPVGAVVTDVGRTSTDADGVNGLLVQADGKIVAAGVTSTLTSVGGLSYRESHGALARYTSAGKLDTTFGGTGIVKSSLAPRDLFSAVTIQQGKILAVGARYHQSATTNDTTQSFALYRYNPNGTLDTSFGPGHTGIVTSDFSSYYTADARAVAVNAAGDIFVGGYVNQTGGVASFAVAQYDPNGNLVTTFGSGGLATATFNVNGVNVSAGATGIALGPDGTIVLAGGTTRFALARFTSAGELDTTFGGTGMVTSTLDPLTNPSVSGVFLQPQTNGTSKIVVGGQGSKHMLLARLNWDGSFDASFGVPAVAATATSAAPLANATPAAAALSAPTAAPTLVSNATTRTVGTTAPSTGRDTKQLQLAKRDYLAVDAALQALDADLLADELTSILAP